MITGFNKRNDMLINPWYTIGYPNTLEPIRRSVENFLGQFDWQAMYDWLQVRRSFLNVCCLCHGWFKISLQMGAMSLYRVDQGNLEIQMTAEQHTKVFVRNQAAGAKNPSPEMFADFFSGIWDVGMSADNEAVMEKRWSTLERVFTPLYFSTRDWVPSVSSHLDQLFEENFSGRLSFRLCIAINVLHL
jgi:hypothetical protein